MNAPPTAPAVPRPLGADDPQLGSISNSGAAIPSSASRPLSRATRAGGVGGRGGRARALLKSPTSAGHDCFSAYRYELSGAERAALDVLYDRVSPGGVFIFDDYGWESSKCRNKRRTNS
jgi:hypothetical protein